MGQEIGKKKPLTTLAPELTILAGEAREELNGRPPKKSEKKRGKVGSLGLVTVH